MSTCVDTKYYQVVEANSLSERLLIGGRANIFSDFMARMTPSATDTVLDVGVSDVVNNGANVLERLYPYPEQITACGLGDGEDFKQAFPRCRYQKIGKDEPLPFGDHSFDIATANAVLEHVGSFEKQVFFMKELCRVARRVFISVPHKYFPVEHHTALPLVHFNRTLFQLACAAGGKQEWTEEENLILMTRKRLWQLAQPIKKSAAVGYTGLRMGPFSSNIFIAFS